MSSPATASVPEEGGSIPPIRLRRVVLPDPLGPRITKNCPRGIWRLALRTSVTAVRSASLQITRGPFLVILGPSGSGKTTLLNLIGGIEPPSSGTLAVAGLDITALGTQQRTAFRRDYVGFVFQFFNLIPTLTALENVQLIAELLDCNGEALSEKSLKSVGLGERMNHFPRALSGGEQQRVAIARALVKQPSLLLADEPTGSLDLDTGRQILALLHQLNRRDNRTVILVTHNSAIANMADRVIRMRSGEIIEDTEVEKPLAPEEVTW